MTASSRSASRTDFFWSAVGLLTGALSALALTMVLTRTQSPAVVAAVASALSLVAVTGPLVSLGAPAAAIPLVSRAESGQRAAVGRALMAQAGALAAGATVALVVASLLLPGDRRSLTAAVAVGMPAVAMAAVADAVARADGRFRAAALLSDGTRRVLLIAAVLLATQADVGLAVALALAAVVHSGVVALLLRGIVRGSSRSVLAAPRHHLVRRTFAFLPLTVFGQVVPQAGVLLADLVSSDQQVGRMAVAVRFYAVTALLYSVTVRVVAPRIANAADVAVLGPWLRHTSARSTALVVAATAAVCLGGPPLSGSLFGTGYRSAWLPAALAAGIVVVQAATGFGGMVLSQRGRHRTAALIALSTSTLFVVGGLIGAKVAGATGIAIAGLAATLANGIATTVTAQRAFGVTLWPWRRTGPEPPPPRNQEQQRGQNRHGAIEGVGADAGAEQ